MIIDARIIFDTWSGKYLQIVFSGCGCCGFDHQHYKKSDALDALQDYEEELKENLKKVRELRRLVKRWKD